MKTEGWGRSFIVKTNHMQKKENWQGNSSLNKTKIKEHSKLEVEEMLRIKGKYSAMYVFYIVWD